MGGFPWNASLRERYLASSLRSSGLYPRSIPALAASGAPPVTLAHHTPFPHPWHGCSHGDHLFLSDSPGCFTFSSIVSMLSKTPGGHGRTCLDVLPHFACAQTERIGGTPNYNSYGATCQIQGSTPSPLRSRHGPFGLSVLPCATE
jgi:hypothetical protein